MSDPTGTLSQEQIEVVSRVLVTIDRLGGGSSVREKTIVSHLGGKDVGLAQLRFVARLGGLSRVGDTWSLTQVARDRLAALYARETSEGDPVGDRPR